jgi:hypothetical protein
MKSRFQKKNIRKSRRQSLRRKIQRGGQVVNCKNRKPCTEPCKQWGTDCMTAKELEALYASQLGRSAPADHAQRPRMQAPIDFLFGR